LYCSKSAHDFGTVSADSQLQHRFQVRNLHPWAVWITSMWSDCGCTSGLMAGKKLPLRLGPFQAATVVGTLKTLGRKGEWNGNITVVTQEPRNGQTRVALSLRATTR
jgi:hypothetical protein